MFKDPSAYQPKLLQTVQIDRCVATSILGPPDDIDHYVHAERLFHMSQRPRRFAYPAYYLMRYWLAALTRLTFT